MLHWHNLFDVLLEIFQVLHELLLLFLELINFCAIFCNGTLAEVVVGDLNVFLIELQEIFSSLGLQGLERIFYRFSLGSKEHLNFNSLAKDGVTTEGHQKCLQEIHSLRDEIFFQLALGLLRRYWGNEKTRIPLFKFLVEQVKLGESPEDLDGSSAVMADDFVDGIFVTKTSPGLLRYDFKRHVAIVSLVVSLHELRSISRNRFVEGWPSLGRARSLVAFAA